MRATAVLGDLDGLVGPDLDGVTSSVPPLDQVLLSIRERPGPGGIDPPAQIFQHFDVRLAPDIGWLTGTRQGSPGGGEARIEGWTCFSDGRQPDVTSLMLFADAFPPAVLDHYRASWCPTLQYSVYVRARPTDDVAPRLLPYPVHGGRPARGGRRALLDSAGQLVGAVALRQLALLLPAT